MHFETVPGLITINATLPLQILHFIILMFILDRILFRPVLRIIEERKIFIKQKRQELETVKKEVEQLKAKFKKMEEEARRKALYERAQLKEEGLKEAEGIIEESKKKVLTMQEEVNKKIKEEVEKTRPFIQKQAKVVADEIIKKIIGTTAVLLIFLLFSSVSIAAEAPSKARIIWNNIMLFVNFGILVFLFFKYAKKPLVNFIFKERDKIKNDIEKLEKEYKDAQLILDEQNRKLSNIEAYVKEIKDSILQLAQRERQKIIEDAKRNAERILEEAKYYQETEVAKAKRQLQEELILMAISFVKERLRKKLTNEMNEKIITAFIKDMEKSVKN